MGVGMTLSTHQEIRRLEWSGVWSVFHPLITMATDHQSGACWEKMTLWSVMFYV